VAFIPLPSFRALAIMAAVGVVTVVGLVEHRKEGDTPTTRTPAGVVNFSGVDDVHFGATSRELTRDHGLTRRPQDCAPILPKQSLVSPVLVDDKLVLLWVNPPLHTPEGITVGSPVSQVRAAYPQAQQLPAPALDQYPALMVTSSDRAYLFLYSDNAVRKLLVGYRKDAEQLYRSGGDTC
jgi:hypothetical protein